MPGIVSHPSRRKRSHKRHNKRSHTKRAKRSHKRHTRKHRGGRGGMCSVGGRGAFTTGATQELNQMSPSPY